MTPHGFSILGLVLDMIGVAMLFETGLPPNMNMFEMYYEMPLKKEYEGTVKWKKRRAYFALVLIISGCILQIIGTATS